MAKVFKNSMVAHVWANQSQPEGRSNNGQFYFEGRKLFSYGRHFVAGFIMPDGTALINADKYSITTSRHLGYAVNAVRGRYFYVPGLTDLANGYAFSADPTKARDSIMWHVRAHALNISDDLALYLLGVVKAARSWPKIKREENAKREKARAARAAREIAARKAGAESVAALTDSDFAERLLKLEEARNWGRFPTGRNWPKTEYRNAHPSENVAAFATELHRLNETAKAHCGKRVQAKIAARLKAARTRAADLKKWERHGVALAAYSRNLADLRAMYAERMATGPLSRERNKALGNLANAVRFARPGLLTDKARESLILLIENCQALEREAAEREAAERMERERADRESWLAGHGPRYWRGSDAQGGALLRAVNVERKAVPLEGGHGTAVLGITGGTLETSHGASVPLVHALKAFAFVRLVVATGNAWQANGRTIRVGHFRIDSIDAHGTMQAGCHTIHFAEMERLAALLNVSDMRPDDSALTPSGNH